MNIKQKLTWAFAAIACVPVILVAVLVVLKPARGGCGQFPRQQRPRDPSDR